MPSDFDGNKCQPRPLRRHGQFLRPLDRQFPQQLRDPRVPAAPLRRPREEPLEGRPAPLLQEDADPVVLAIPLGPAHEPLPLEEGRRHLPHRGLGVDGAAPPEHPRELALVEEVGVAPDGRGRLQVGVHPEPRVGSRDGGEPHRGEKTPRLQLEQGMVRRRELPPGRLLGPPEGRGPGPAEDPRGGPVEGHHRLPHEHVPGPPDAAVDEDRPPLPDPEVGGGGLENPRAPGDAALAERPGHPVEGPDLRRQPRLLLGLVVVEAPGHPHQAPEDPHRLRRAPLPEPDLRRQGGAVLPLLEGEPRRRQLRGDHGDPTVGEVDGRGAAQGLEVHGPAHGHHRRPVGDVDEEPHLPAGPPQEGDGVVHLHGLPVVDGEGREGAQVLPVRRRRVRRRGQLPRVLQHRRGEPPVDAPLRQRRHGVRGEPALPVDALQALEDVVPPEPLREARGGRFLRPEGPAEQPLQGRRGVRGRILRPLPGEGGGQRLLGGEDPLLRLPLHLLRPDLLRGGRHQPPLLQPEEGGRPGGVEDEGQGPGVGLPPLTAPGEVVEVEGRAGLHHAVELPPVGGGTGAGAEHLEAGGDLPLRDPRHGEGPGGPEEPLRGVLEGAPLLRRHPGGLPAPADEGGEEDGAPALEGGDGVGGHRGESTPLPG